RNSGSLAGGGDRFARLQDGDGMEGRLPPAPGVPHPADGLVRSALVADPVGGGGGQDVGPRWHAGRAFPRIPVRYLANLLTAGAEEPIVAALERMLAMRAYMRAKTVDGRIDESIPAKVGL